MRKGNYLKLSPSTAVAWLVLITLGSTSTVIRRGGAGGRHSQRFLREERSFYE